MRTLEGPGRFLAGEPPWDGSASIAAWARDLGWADVEARAFASRQLDLERAASSQTDCDASQGPAAAAGLEITEPSAHPQCRLGDAHSAYDERFDQTEQHGIDNGFGIHPGEDLHAGAGCEMSLDRVGQHPRALMPCDLSPDALPQPDHPANPDIRADRSGVFHVEDAEFGPSGRQGGYGGRRSQADHPEPFRGVGVGEVDVGAIVSELAAMDVDRGAAVPWACALKHPEDGALLGLGR